MGFSNSLDEGIRFLGEELLLDAEEGKVCCVGETGVGIVLTLWTVLRVRSKFGANS
jgi:hypothetical protein